MKEAIKAEVFKSLSRNLDMTLDQLHEDLTLIGDCGVDSLSMVEIVMDLEDKFNLEIDEKAILGCRTVNDVVNGMVRIMGA